MGRIPLLVVAVVGVLALAAPAYAAGAPTSSAKPPPSADSTTFDIPYTASDGASGSGIATVDLYAKGPSDPGFNKVATDTTPDTPSFTYAANEGNGVYSFYTRATDKSSNQEPEHPGADGSTMVDTTQQSKSFVAAVSLQKGQDLNTVLQKGLALELIANRAVSLKLELSVSPRIAQALRLRSPTLVVHNWQVIMPKTYAISLRMNRATVRHFRKVKRVHFELRSVLSTTGGNSIATNPLTFGRP